MSNVKEMQSMSTLEGGVGVFWIERHSSEKTQDISFLMMTMTMILKTIVTILLTIIGEHFRCFNGLNYRRKRNVSQLIRSLLSSSSSPLSPLSSLSSLSSLLSSEADSYHTSYQHCIRQACSSHQRIVFIFFWFSCIRICQFFKPKKIERRWHFLHHISINISIIKSHCPGIAGH